VCAGLAAAQKGVIARSQLLEQGIHPSQVKRWTRAGSLHRLHHGVYAVGHLALAPLAREQAAILACGNAAILSHASAAYLWGMLPERPEFVQVAVVARQCRVQDGIRVHRVALLARRDIRRRDGLWLTSPARTAIDLAATAGPVELEDAVAEARVRNLIRDGEIEAALERAGRARGAAAMRRFLAEEGGPQITRSRAERRFRGHLRQAELPQPKTNGRAAGFEVDFLWEPEKVVLEVDGWRFHGHRRAFEWDRKKDMILRDAGYLVIRVTWRQFTEQPLVVIAHVARMLDRAGR
jgi:very-short-patch-repair endonuclease